MEDGSHPITDIVPLRRGKKCSLVSLSSAQFSITFLCVSGPIEGEVYNGQYTGDFYRIYSGLRSRHFTSSIIGEMSKYHC